MLLEVGNDVVEDGCKFILELGVEDKTLSPHNQARSAFRGVSGMNGCVNQPRRQYRIKVFERRLKFGLGSDDEGSATCHRMHYSFHGLLYIPVSKRFVFVELWEVVDIKGAIGDFFDE